VPFTELLASREIQPVTYVDWLKVERAEAELAASLGRGERVKIGDRDTLEALCRPPAG
jgi:ferredoxin--NADP+ reductase